MSLPPLPASRHLEEVKYEIRGPLARRAYQLEHEGYEIIRLNIGNPGAFGYRMPESMRRAMVEQLPEADAYCHQKGLFTAREAIVMQQQSRGVMDVTADDVVIGNGVSELIMMCMRALLNPEDEILVPYPDYPLWTASVVIHGAKAVHYPCHPENAFHPRLEDIESRITDKTRGIVIINPNNPTGAVYSESLLRGIVKLAEAHGLVLFADEIYDAMTYETALHIPVATLQPETLCVTFAGLSKVYRACGMRVGWASFSGLRSHARGYMDAVELLASLRLCSNVPGQSAVQTALGGFQSIHQLTGPGGRLFESRAALIDVVEKSQFLSMTPPEGAMYGFIRVDAEQLPGFSDQTFALELLEQKHVLVAPGTSFNVPYRDHFRTNFLPDPKAIREVFGRIEELLLDYRRRARKSPKPEVE